jgi:PhnB protein
MRLSTHLVFDGQCEAAFKLYERCLGGRDLVLVTYASSPMAAEVPSGWGDKIVHASLTVGAATVLSGADVVAESYERPAGFFVLLSVADAATAKRIFDELAEGGQIRMALRETFWSPTYGVLVDRFGIPWEISCERG